MSIAKVASLSTLNLFANGIRVVLSFVASILLGRWTVAHQFGEINLILSYTAFLNYFLTFGFEQSLPYFVPPLLASNDRDTIRSIFRYALRASIFFGFIVCVLCAVLLPKILVATEHRNLYFVGLIFVLQMCVGAVSLIYSGLLRATKSMRASIFKDQILFSLLHLVGILLFLRSASDAIFTYTFIYFTATALTFLVGTYQVRKLLPWISKKSPAPASGLGKAWFRFSFPLGISASLESFFIWGAIAMLGWLASSSDVARFAVCLRVSIFMQFANMALSPIIAPFFAEMKHSTRDDVQLKRLFHIAIITGCLWSLAVGFVLLAMGNFVLGVFGHEYLSAFSCLALVVLGSGIEGAFGTVRQSLAMQGKNDLHVTNTVIALIINLSLSLVLVPRYGINGAAVAYSIALIVMNSLRVIQHRIYCQLWPTDKTALFVLTVLFLLLTGTIALLRINGTSASHLSIAVGFSICCFGLAGYILLKPFASEIPFLAARMHRKISVHG